jgi:hypothetical protein
LQHFSENGRVCQAKMAFWVRGFFVDAPFPPASPPIEIGV